MKTAECRNSVTAFFACFLNSFSDSCKNSRNVKKNLDRQRWENSYKKNTGVKAQGRNVIFIHALLPFLPSLIFCLSSSICSLGGVLWYTLYKSKVLSVKAESSSTRVHLSTRIGAACVVVSNWEHNASPKTGTER